MHREEKVDDITGIPSNEQRKTSEDKKKKKKIEKKDDIDNALYSLDFLSIMNIRRNLVGLSLGRQDEEMRSLIHKPGCGSKNYVQKIQRDSERQKL